MTLSFHKHAGAQDLWDEWDMRHLWLPEDSLGGERVSGVVSAWIGQSGAWSGVRAAWTKTWQRKTRRDRLGD